MTDRILWNERGADIDEVVLHDVATVHVEQQDSRCWWIGVTKADGTEWAGNFTADSRGVMRFSEQESTVVWGEDREHETRRADPLVVAAIEATRADAAHQSKAERIQQALRDGDDLPGETLDREGLAALRRRVLDEPDEQGATT